ncbi:MAG: hypothetical protein F4X56_00160 [Gammaproteobacteria bacterium]|nr:hypothetical protein [Gammaproteobacteria bacterium]MYC24311.1 hypothetical protein [Gammaproteobacteria bacterium]
MKRQISFLGILGLILVLVFGLSSCNTEEDNASADETAEVDAGESDEEEHESETSGGGEHSGEEMGDEESGEESGTQYAKTDTYDETRNGARLVLNYDSEANAFIGTVENTTDETLKQVRVEVHLSNGTELGPTEPSDLEPGKSMDVSLFVFEEEFETWGAHPEVGESSGSEHGSEENHE